MDAIAPLHYSHKVFALYVVIAVLVVFFVARSSPSPETQPQHSGASATTNASAQRQQAPSSRHPL